MRWALVRISLAVTSMVVLAFAVPLGLVVKQLAEDRAISGAERQAAAVAPALAITTDREQLQRAVASTEAGAARRLAVHLPPAEPVPDDADPPLTGTGRVSAAEVRKAREHGRAGSLHLPDGVAWLQPIAVDGGRIAVVEVFIPGDDLTSGVVASWLVLASVGVGLTAVSVVIADRLGRRTVRPAEQLAAAAEELGRGQLSVRVPEEGPSELRSAAVAFNGMTQRVAGLLANEREMAADLSHRLRTPLTVLRLNAASLGDQDAAVQTRQAVDQLEAEVDAIIAAVRENRDGTPGSEAAAGAGGVSGTDPLTDVAAIVQQRMAFWSALAEDEGRATRLTGVTRQLPVSVAPGELAAALDALLGNVFRHTPQGTAFAVTVRTDTDSGQVTVRIADAGSGIADRDHALRRGAGDGRPGSTGLGLDIARRVAESTGGDLRIGQSALGGTEVRLRLGIPAPSAGRTSRRVHDRRRHERRLTTRALPPPPGGEH